MKSYMNFLYLRQELFRILNEWLWSDLEEFELFLRYTEHHWGAFVIGLSQISSFFSLYIIVEVFFVILKHSDAGNFATTLITAAGKSLDIKRL